MPAINSSFNGKVEELAGIAKLPIARSKRSVDVNNSSNDLPQFESIVDEALYLFRVNVFFKNFELKGPADRTLLYAQLFVQECLSQIAASKLNRKEAEKSLLMTASSPNFLIPGDSGFNLSALFPSPATRHEADGLRRYLTDLRVELVHGLLDRVFAADANVADKWWLSFGKRKFMNKTL